MVGHLIFRLTIWFLLTANFTVTNIIIGVALSLLLPRRYSYPETLKDWLLVLGKILLAIPQAYLEAFELMFRPHDEEEVILKKVAKQRSHRLVFLDIFLITFTPKTIVLKYQEEEGWYEIHILRRKKACS
ncbi:MAG: Na+/H+ antiporter subunit E [Oscillatoriaceae bacterium SKW80]|nr:Na+/H+ antiporter subunit E [Oscillatoriaceae bacterium SKYG93]MCX8121679.1 Na+/H+ antiporter subunit E [Oscillatoriaceae bacterium SKW80]MDW8453988.1 Na+/H+ antiporter subunit E [Oscillatoriaceae cyanobacterium SKYGB_i_bin93]HIK28769.1 Na+/H+ antiporter subunit E [Oscillatoriaceae cyanobacterium M7585_C2015_266]